MKFEFVEFYKFPDTTKNKSCKGTVHLYFVDQKMDVRGIMVSLNGKSMYFMMPHMYTFDLETNKKVRYPVISWVDEKAYKEIFDFLQKEVKPIILERLKNKE